MAGRGWQRDLAVERRRIERALAAELRAEKGIPERLRAAMRHSLMAGGKRLRPVLVLWAWDAAREGRRKVPADRDAVLRAACGLEMLHTYSLIHDDLPAMDDDVLRRGRPTCHVAFDEATAILAGDGLQALGLQRIAESGGAVAAEAVAHVARAVGPAGMAGGQQDDLDSEGLEADSRRIRRIHLNKTGALLGAAYALGGLLGGLGREGVDALDRAGRQLGLAFQCADDILDVTASPEMTGKSAGKDEAQGKATWVRLEGIERTRRRMARYGSTARRDLEAALHPGVARERLIQVSEMLWNRDR